jgi:hypothetical protein
MKVFRVNDCEWYMAPTLEEAVQKCMDDCKLPRDEAVDDPRECTPEEMGRLTFMDDVYNPEKSERRTFAEELARRIAAGKGTEMFATTEF